MPGPSTSLPAMALVETSSIARGFVVVDAAIKRSPVSVKFARPASPGKFVCLFAGDVEAVAMAYEAALEAAGSLVIDHVCLPGMHPHLLNALGGEVVPAAGESVAVFEYATAASAVAAADAALKCVDAAVVRMQLSLGLSGKAFFVLTGPLDAVAYVADEQRSNAHQHFIAVEVIAQPHPEMRGFLFGAM